MTWMKDTYSTIYGDRDINADACTTGKFVNQGGIEGRIESTGLGVYYGLKELMDDAPFMKNVGLTTGIDGKKFAIQGFGNVGYWASKFLEGDGGKIEVIIEHDCAIYKKGGFNVDELNEWKTKNKSFKNYKDFDEKEIDNPAVFMHKDVDVLIPAAVEKSIHKGNAPHIKAKIIGEAANGPTTPRAEEILQANGSFIIPDMILNGGGVTVSYFEWLKNLQHVAPGRLTKKWEQKSQRQLYTSILGDKADEKILAAMQGADEKDIVYSGLEEIMSSAVRENWEECHEFNKNMRNAAFLNAIERVATAYEHCGLLI
jgi:glutamate dehydrogenase (NAD(P)+)